MQSDCVKYHRCRDADHVIQQNIIIEHTVQSIFHNVCTEVRNKLILSRFSDGRL